MNETAELKQVLGALLFTARKPLPASEMRQILLAAAEEQGGGTRRLAQIREAEIRKSLDQMKTELANSRLGLHLVEVAGGYRFQTDAAAGPWVRHMLDLGKPTHLSRPTLETLAIIAYRQPVTRAAIEAVRGVTVDTIVRHLLELQLIRITGRSELPGRPLLYGTTQLFLEHFGLNSVRELPGIEQLCQREAERERLTQPGTPPSEEDLEADDDDADDDDEDDTDDKTVPESAAPAADKPAAPSEGSST